MTTDETSAIAPKRPSFAPIGERRLKIVSIHRRFLIDVLNWWRNPPHYVALPITDELPEDCVVVSVEASWERDCIEAMVTSKEFPPCPEGEVLDRIPGMTTEFRVVSFQSADTQITSGIEEKAMSTEQAEMSAPVQPLVSQLRDTTGKMVECGDRIVVFFLERGSPRKSIERHGWYCGVNTGGLHVYLLEMPDGTTTCLKTGLLDMCHIDSIGTRRSEREQLLDEAETVDPAVSERLS